MKSLKALLALVAVCAFGGSLALAEATAKADKAACGCTTGADAKVCGTDKDCCCTGEKADKKAEKAAAKAEKKAE